MFDPQEREQLEGLADTLLSEDVFDRTTAELTKMLKKARALERELGKEPGRNLERKMGAVSAAIREVLDSL